MFLQKGDSDGLVDSPDSVPFIVGLKVRPYNWRMQQARKAKGLTQAQLGELVGVHQTTISSLERLDRKQWVDWDVCDRIADILDEPANALFPSWMRPNIIREAASGNLPVPLTRDVVDQGTDLVQQVLRGEMFKAVNAALETLPQRDALVLRYRFGFEIGRPETLEETGWQLGWTREYVRQLEAHGLRRLRHPSRAKLLRPYLELIGVDADPEVV